MNFGITPKNPSSQIVLTKNGGPKAEVTHPFRPQLVQEVVKSVERRSGDHPV